MQMTLDFDASLTEAYATCREYVGTLVHQQGKPHKAIAADMDLSPSQLTRKLAQSPNDTSRFTVDDLERFIQCTDEIKPIKWLVAKYCFNADRIRELEREIEFLKGKGLP